MSPKDHNSKDHVAVRLDSPTLSRVDALKAVFTTPWHPATRSDILRAIILTGLDSLEQVYGVAGADPHRAAEPSARERSPNGPRQPVDPVGKKFRPPARTG